METITLAIANETAALKELRHHLDAKIFCKQKTDICLYFDEKPSPSFFKEILGAFFDYKSAYLKMIKYEVKSTPGIRRSTIRNGEIIECQRHSILIGDIHEGGQVDVKGNLIVIGEVSGLITLNDDECSVFATKFSNAKIVTSFNEMHRVTGRNMLINNKCVGGKICQE